MQSISFENSLYIIQRVITNMTVQKAQKQSVEGSGFGGAKWMLVSFCHPEEEEGQNNHTRGHCTFAAPTGVLACSEAQSCPRGQNC